MAPNVRYATTVDGVSIAWAEEGAGPPIVTTIVPFGMVEAPRGGGSSWRVLARSFRLVTYDPRGVGLSDRSATDFSMAAMQRDLDAVIGALETTPVALGGTLDAVPVMVAYAAEHPDKVSHLILRDGWARFSDQQQSVSFNTMTRVMDADWKHATDILVRVLLGINEAHGAAEVAEYIRGAMSREAFRESQDALASWGVEHLLSRVTAPTLVMQSRGNPWVPVSAGQQLASGIRGAAFRLIDDLDSEGRAQMIEEFVLGEARATRGQQQAAPGGGMMAVIMFADIADSTALTERMGDAAFRAKARALDGALRGAVREHGGTVIDAKTLGDGILATFAGASQAIGAALACAAAGEGQGMPVHVGLHAGDVIREDGNVFGGAVNIAARICGLSAPGEILVSDVVRGMARTSAGVGFEDRGEFELKGVGEAVRVYAVRAAPA